MLLARVAVPVPLGQAFTYAVSAELAARVQRGARVLCEFGRRKLLGVVLDVGEREPDIAPEKIKALGAVVAEEPVLSEELLSFLQELGRYYVAPIGEVIQLALPALERSAARALGTAEARVVGRVVQVASTTLLAPTGLRGKAPELWAFLKESGPTELPLLVERWSSARTLVKRLEALGAVSVETREAAANTFFSSAVPRDTPPQLTDAQSAAVQSINQQLDSGERGAFLLDGVTASGKTEVYLRAVQHAVEQGRSAIVLVPEIALTPQLVTRFRARLGDEIAVLHSGLSDGERQAMWKALRSGKLRVAIGARSALFAPVERLGLICTELGSGRQARVEIVHEYPQVRHSSRRVGCAVELECRAQSPIDHGPRCDCRMQAYDEIRYG